MHRQAHRNKFYIKKKLDVEKGSKKSKVFAGHPTAREAAITFAEFLDAPFELPETKRKSTEKRLDFLYRFPIQSGRQKRQQPSLRRPADSKRPLQYGNSH